MYIVGIDIAKRFHEAAIIDRAGHVCHKIIAIIFAVLRDNKPYVPAPTT